MSFNKPQAVLDALAQAYYEEKNIEAVLSCVTDDVEWIGTEHNEIAKGKEELTKLLDTHFLSFPNVFHVELNEPKLQMIGSDLAVLTLTGNKLNTPGAPVGFSIRGTICCTKTEQGWLIFNLHMSAPNAEVEKTSLLNTLDEERKKQKALLDNIPGGIAMYRLKKDGRIPIDYASDGLAHICGYENSEDFMKVVKYDFRKLILTEDLPIIVSAFKTSIEKGLPSSVQCRVNDKNGNPVCTTLDSVIMKNAKLDADDIAVFYAVQTLVSTEATQKAEEQKTLISLLNTVPAGIGIFKVNEFGITQNYLNDAFYRLLNTTRAERTQYFGTNALSTAHPKDMAKLKQAMKDMLDGKNSAQLYYRLMGGLGNWVWLHLTANVVERTRDYVIAHIAFYECTETKQQELQLLQNQRAVTLAETQGRIAIWTYNIDKGIIEQQTLVDANGHMGYPLQISNVPQCFVDSGSVYPEDIQKFLLAYKNLESDDKKVDVLYRLKDHNTGKFDWIHMYCQRTDNNDDGDRIAVGFSLEVNKQQDAIERYHIEQKLREQIYANAAVYLEYNLTNRQYEEKNNLDTRYPSLYWESKTKEEYRKKMSTIIDEPYLDEIVDKTYADNLLKLFQKGESKVSCEYRSQERPGMPSAWYRISYTMVKRPDTEDIMAFVCVEDIDNEKNQQLAIESSMSDGIESVAIIHLTDGKTQLILENGIRLHKKSEKHFIYNDDFVKRSSKVTVPEEREFSYNAALLSTVKKELENQDIYQYTISSMLNSNHKKRKLFRFRYLDNRKANIIMSVSDVTSLYQEEQNQKMQLENALKQLQKASHAKADFYSRMSHDMRTPMNGVLGMVALSEDETDIATLKENMEKIKESGEYLLSLINDTLDLQRIESGKLKLEPTIVSTIDVVNNIIDMISVTAKAKGVQLKYNKGNTELNWYIRADALRLKQIFVNLLSNAIKFTPPGGTVDFEFNLLSREGMISHDVVYVRDTGVGMSKEFLKSGIFKPFSQERNDLSANYAGSGLGLSIAKSLVEMMGGKIEVESELGVGTTFAVYIDFERVDKAHAKAAMQREKKQAKDVVNQLKYNKILLVEDHPLNAEIAKKLLQKAGCEVIWSKNGKEAVSFFAKEPVNTFDAILMDIRMPIMDGLEATRQIRALDKADALSIPIIAMTANAYEEDMKASLDAGMNSHLGKPINPKDLYDTLAIYLNKTESKN